MLAVNLRPQRYRSCSYCLRRAFRLSAPTLLDQETRTPRLLLKLREDLKSALRAKDGTRLDTLRGVLADVTNKAKSGNAKTPSTDIEILSILRKRATISRQASDQFESSGRLDLKQKEDAQVRILEEYGGQVDEMTDSDIRDAVGKVIEELSKQDEKMRKSDAMKKLFGPNGPLADRNVDRKRVVEVLSVCLGPS